MIVCSTRLASRRRFEGGTFLTRRNSHTPQVHSLHLRPWTISSQHTCPKSYSRTDLSNNSTTKPSLITMAAGKKSVDQWEALFKAADKDNSGTLDVYELRDMLRKGNCNMADSQIADAFVYFDGPKGDKKITLDEFKKGMHKLEDIIRKLGQLFKQYDSDNSGYLDKDELKKILDASGYKFTDAEVNQILREADSSGDGKISFQEFMDACC